MRLIVILKVRPWGKQQVYYAVASMKPWYLRVDKNEDVT